MFALDISPDSSVLISGSSDESLKMWDLNQWPPGKLNSIEEVHDLGMQIILITLLTKSSQTNQSRDLRENGPK